METKTLTIFGSSIPIPGEKEYEDAYFIGKTLAKKGFNICSGGAQGIMDAVSKGAKEEGREAIGITIAVFNAVSSSHLTKEISRDTLFQRLDDLISYGDGFIILPGGTGTLLEISLLWEMFNKNLLGEKPTACLGEMWKKIVEPMEERIKYENRKQNLVRCFENRDDLVNFFITAFKP